MKRYEEEKLPSAILVYVADKSEKTDPEAVLNELELLAETAGYQTAAHFVQKKELPDRKYLLGSGKVQELKTLVDALDAEIVIFDNDVNGIQYRNLEDELQVDVIDRATLILEIFANHATTNEGKLQVELARKKHALPRTLGQGAVLSRQGGGGGGGGGARRGAGEQKLELDKRTIRKEIHDLEERIRKLTDERRLRREKRVKSRIKTVSIVGYTNAGKSTLMNSMTKAGVLAEDKLFATLDPVSRKLWLGENREFLLTDTVGFISRLPHEFIDAFRSTLEETKYADLILLVVDSASPKLEEEYDVVREVLKSLEITDTPVITVMNKADKTDGVKYFPSAEKSVVVSAKTGEGVEQLKRMISEILFPSERGDENM